MLIPVKKQVIHSETNAQDSPLLAEPFTDPSPAPIGACVHAHFSLPEASQCHVFVQVRTEIA